MSATALVNALALLLVQPLPAGADRTTPDAAHNAGDPPSTSSLDEGERPAHRPRRYPVDRDAMQAMFAADPPVADLRDAATALALAEPDRARSLVERSRLAGYLPELRVLVERRFARTESVDLGTASDAAALAPVGIDSNNDVRYQARATWDLGKIAFNPDEIAAQFQALRTGDTRREIESLVVRLYFERRRLKVESAAADDLDMPSGWRRELRISEIEAELDAVTAGAFTRLTERRTRNRQPMPSP
jgi:hypothetical protein